MAGYQPTCALLPLMSTLPGHLLGLRKRGPGGCHHDPFGRNRRRGGAAISDERSLALIRTRAAAMRAAVVPDWLAELVRPKPAPWPWPDMIRAALAITVLLPSSGWPDLNRRPPRPKRGALAKLRYSPS